ncbi:MAG: SET domain-containing protein [Granulosicoccus sp.]
MSTKDRKPKRKNAEAKSNKRDKPKKGSAGKKSGGVGKTISPRLAKLMSRFKKARLSDVSDKVFVATSPVHGKGLFAAKRIKANTVLGRLQGMPTFDDGIYVLWITEDIGLELTNDFKYINHNSKPNAAYSDLDVTVLRDVEPGEELLHDYGW